MKFAKILGKIFAEEILSTSRERQNWRPLGPDDEIPPGDYRALRDFYGTVSTDVVRAYKDEFNAILEKGEK